MNPRLLVGNSMRLIEFESEMDRLSYPATTGDVVDEFGGDEIDFQDGVARVDQVLGEGDAETFASPDELRMTLYGSLPEAAIGRKGYTDRDPPSIGEFDHVSF